MVVGFVDIGCNGLPSPLKLSFQNDTTIANQRICLA